MNALRRIWASGIARSAAGYTAGNMLSAGIPFLALPFLTRSLSPTDYGVYAIFGIISNGLVAVVGFSSHGALLVRLTKSERGEDGQKFLAAAVYFSLAAAAVSSLVAFAFAAPLEKALGVEGSWIILAALTALGQVWVQLAATFFQARQKPVGYVIVRVTQVTIMVLLMIVFSSVFSLGWKGQVLAQLISVCLVGFLAMAALLSKKEIAPATTRAQFGYLVRFGGPLVPHALLSMLIPMSSRWMIGVFVDVAQVGVFTVASQISSVVSVIGTSFTLALSPRLMKLLTVEKEESRLRVVHGIAGGSLVILGFAAVLCAVAQIALPHFLGQEYSNARYYLVPLAVGSAFQAIYQLVTVPVFMKEKTKILSMATVFCSVLHLAFSYALIKWGGAMGASFAFAFTYFIFMVVTWRISQSIEPLPWRAGLKTAVAVGMKKVLSYLPRGRTQ